MRAALLVPFRRDYTDPLAEMVEPAVQRVEIPTAGLQIGDTLAWYNERLEDA